MKKAVLVFVAALSLHGAAQAQDAKLRIPGWEVLSEKDPFDDTKRKFIALRETTDSSAVFAVRCLQGTRSFAMLSSAFSRKVGEGDVVTIKFKSDDNPIGETMGVVVGDNIVQFYDQKLKLQVDGGKRVALRISTERGVSLDFSVTTPNSERVISQLNTACPI